MKNNCQCAACKRLNLLEEKAHEKSIAYFKRIVQTRKFKEQINRILTTNPQ